MADLVVDTEMLIETGAQLAIVAQEFEDADRYAESVADAVGDDTLAEAVSSFTTDWKGRREKMRESIENLAELTGAVGTELAGIDGDLASSLEEGK